MFNVNKMNINDKLEKFSKQCKVKTIRSTPIFTGVRSRSLRSLYTYEDFLIDLLRHYATRQRVYHPHIPTLIVQFLPLYNWKNPWHGREDSDEINDKVRNITEVFLSHSKTIA